MFTRLRRSDNRLLTSSVNTSNEHNSCFPSQLVLAPIALSLSGGGDSDLWVKYSTKCFNLFWIWKAQQQANSLLQLSWSVSGRFDIFCISTTKISMNVKNQVRGRAYYTPTWHYLQIKVWQKIFRHTWKTWRKTECKCRERRRGIEVVINLKNDPKIVTAAAACKKETDLKERIKESWRQHAPSLFQKISKSEETGQLNISGIFFCLVWRRSGRCSFL